MVNEATINVNVKTSDIEPVSRALKAAAAHVARAKEKHGMTSPDDCYEPTMAELWRALLALQEWMDSPPGVQ